MHAVEKNRPTEPGNEGLIKAVTLGTPCALCGAARACMPRLFENIDPAAFDRVVCGKRKVPRHTILCRENEAFSMLYVVRLGQFKILRRDPVGVSRVVKFHLPGDIIGMDAIASGEHGARAMALEDSEVCEISYLQLKHVVASEPRFAEKFLHLMSESMANQDERSTLLSMSSPEARFLSFLLSLSEKFGRIGYSTRAFRLAMSRSDISSYLGTTVETVSRLISRCNAQRSVRIDGRMVNLIDREGLQQHLDNAGANAAVRH